MPGPVPGIHILAVPLVIAAGTQATCDWYLVYLICFVSRAAGRMVLDGNHRSRTATAIGIPSAGFQPLIVWGRPLARRLGAHPGFAVAKCPVLGRKT